MCARQVIYPFGPRSIAHLLGRAAFEWLLRLRQGLWVPGKSDPKPSLYLNAHIFLAGLLDWHGEEPPTGDASAGCGLLAQGMAHVAAISDTASVIIGQRDLSLDGLMGLREISHRAGGTVWLYEGGQRLRPATEEECLHSPGDVHVGRRVIQVLAEKHFASH